LGKMDFSVAKVIGLIGCGAWGTNILRDLIGLNCREPAVDVDSRARSKASANGAAKAFSEMGELPECDGYVMAVPIPDLTKTCAS